MCFHVFFLILSYAKRIIYFIYFAKNISGVTYSRSKIIYIKQYCYDVNVKLKKKDCNKIYPYN